MRISAAHRPAQHTCQNLGCYHAGSGSLNLPSTLSPGRYAGVSSFRHAREPQKRAVDLTIRRQSPASCQPRLPYAGHSDDPFVSLAFLGQSLPSSPVALCSRSVYSGMDFSVHWPRLRRQAPGILSGLALSVCRSPLVVGEDPRQGLSVFLLFREEDAGPPTFIQCGPSKNAAMFPHLARFTDLALLLMRLMVGLVFVADGYSHLQDP